jgi:hypothetical protein
MLMSFSRALFVAWCAWIGTLVVGSVIVLLLDKSEWRVTVGMPSYLKSAFLRLFTEGVASRG